MDKQVDLNKDFMFVYYNWRLRKPTNEEIYEASIRDFVAKSVPSYDKVEIVRKQLT